MFKFKHSPYNWWFPCDSHISIKSVNAGLMNGDSDVGFLIKIYWSIRFAGFVR